jgi:hypothetical protein
MRSRSFISVGCASLLSLATCGRAIDEPLQVQTQLSVGTWGGANAGAIVTDSITHVHIACTFGDIKGRIALDSAGRFTVNGTFVLRAYPVYVGPELPAQFSGVVEGKSLTLAVAVADTTNGTVVSLGPVTVKLGTDPQMGPCPICTVPGMRMRVLPVAK